MTKAKAKYMPKTKMKHKKMFVGMINKSITILIKNKWC